MTAPSISVRAAGRVNVIGEHTDYTGGLALPMAIDLGTTVTVTRAGNEVRLRSDHHHDHATVPLDIADPRTVMPTWARYVAGVVAELRPALGATGTVTSTLPIGAGLSSSAALEIAVAVALGFDGSPVALAELCQRAEQRASGVPCGILDQLAIATGSDGSLMRIDCGSLTATPVSLPGDLVVVAVDSGERRELSNTAYATRRSECAAAEAMVGSLRAANVEDLIAMTDPAVRRRARHVITENSRVDQFIDAIGRADYVGAGALLIASHRSLRDDFEVSTPTLDGLVERLSGLPGVYGARMTGGGFGGMAIALCDHEITLPSDVPARRLRPVTGIITTMG